MQSDLVIIKQSFIITSFIIAVYLHKKGISEYFNPVFFSCRCEIFFVGGIKKNSLIWFDKNNQKS